MIPSGPAAAVRGIEDQTTDFIFPAQTDASLDPRKTPVNCRHASGLRAARAAGGWPPKHACGHSAGRSDPAWGRSRRQGFILPSSSSFSSARISAPRLCQAFLPSGALHPAPVDFGIGAVPALSPLGRGCCSLRRSLSRFYHPFILRLKIAHKAAHTPFCLLVRTGCRLVGKDRAQRSTGWNAGRGIVFLHTAVRSRGEKGSWCFFSIFLSFASRF